MEQLFRHPLSDAEEVNRRSNLFRYFGSMGLTFPLSGTAVGEMENYLDAPGSGNPAASLAGALRRRVSASLVRDEAHGILLAGLLATVHALRVVYRFVTDLETRDPQGPFVRQLREAKVILEDARLSRVLRDDRPEEWGLTVIAQQDYLLRTGFRAKLEQVRRLLAELDVYIAVGNLAKDNGFGYAQALAAEADVVRITDLRHPAVSKAVGNDITLDTGVNMLFLTGANMAGKSTLMKSFGIALYLAHIGFPVAADEMVFSMRDGLFSSINVSDDLGQGYSHFYAEVLRVKKVAGAVASGRRLVVLFDELFKGTNVKDAYDGTLAVTEAFARYRQSLFIISTHIVETGEALRERQDNLRYAYLPTILDSDKPRYSYRLQDGIAADRVGMRIIENEQIISIIKQQG